LVRGTASEALREEEAQRFRAVVGHVVLREVDGAGHLVARDRPAELADALLEHFARAPVGARHQGGHALM
jgi:pimeloyl-ACP methyl ester carboxylesterase